MDAKLLLVAIATMTIALPIGNTFAQGGEEAVEIGVRYEPITLLYRLLPFIMMGAGIAGFIIWKQRHKKFL